MRNTENKLSLTVNPYTFSILENDARVFSKKENSLSNLINTIILNYKDDSIASVSRRIQEERIRFKDTLLTGSKERHTRFSTEETDRIIDTYIEGYAKTLMSKKKEPFIKGINKIIYLSTEVTSFLYPNENYANWQEGKYYKSQNAYVKALLEDYANQPFYIREQICCKDILDQLNTYLSISEEKRGLIRIHMKPASGGSKLLYVKPYKLTTDPESRYTYLVGYMSDSEDGLYKIASLRLSRIIDAERMPKISSVLSKEDISAIDYAIKTRGITYLIGETETITVKLTDNGLKMYNSIIHLRPAYIKKETLEDGFTLLDFSCTQMQIRNYFFQFGADAEVIEPQSLANTFKDNYLKAAAAYTEAIDK